MRYSSRYASTLPRRNNRAMRFSPRRRRRGISPVALLAVAAVVLVGAVVGGVLLLLSDGRGTVGKSPASVNASAKLHSGVTIDGVNVGGMTSEEAKAKIAPEQQTRASAVGVTITCGTSTVKYDSSEVKYSFDTDAVLDKALRQNASGKFVTTLAVDPSGIEAQVREFASSLSTPAVNAMVLGFDPARPVGQQFTCSGDVPGVQVDADALWAAVKKQFDLCTFGTVQASAVPVQAKATKAWIENNMKLIRSFTTRMYDHSAPRLTNIRLAAAAVSGKMILPGEQFSMNDATGQRTAAQGYQIAHVINAGVEDNGLGGGVCQVSGTLFNAAVRAGLDIISRTPHTSKSQYLPLGQDATVDYGHKDLVLQNSGTTPVYIYITVDTKSPWQVTASIYGQPLPDGETIELDSTTDVTDLPALDTWRAEDSQAVDPGAFKIEKPRDGHRITVYRVYLKDGVEVDRNKLDTVTYPATGTVVLYYPGDTPPAEGMTTTPPPSATPTPDPTPTPKASHTPKPTPSPTPSPSEDVTENP